MAKSSSLRILIRNMFILIGSLSTVVCLVFVVININQSASNSINFVELNSELPSNCSKEYVWNRNLENIRKSYVKSLWGSYSPGLYFGLKTATNTHSISTGIMWADIKSAEHRLRHNTAQDELDHFDWIIHDGRSFGIERMKDSKAGLLIDATFVIPDQHAAINTLGSPTWIQSFDLSPMSPSDNSFFFYFGIECGDTNQRAQCMHDSALSNLQVVTDNAYPGELSVYGYSKTSGWFCFLLTAGPVNVNEESAASISFSTLSRFDTSIAVGKVTRDFERSEQLSRLPPSSRREASSGVFAADGALNNVVEEGSTFIVIKTAFSSHSAVTASLFEHLPDVHSAEDLALFIAQRQTEEEQSSDVSNRRRDEIRQALSDWTRTYSEAFNRRFEFSFPLKVSDQEVASDSTSRSFSPSEVAIGRRALSAVMGGIGFFHGSPRLGDALDSSDVDGSDTTSVVTTAQAPRHLQQRAALSLLTGTPSRTIFPRGFLWDEGFHQLLISRWDPALTMQTVSDWLQAMHFADPQEGCHPGGWIPREMILGAEALKRVPEEFVTQRVNVANPPTLLLAIEGMLYRLESGGFPQECGSAENSCPSVALDDPVLSFLADSYPLLHQWVQWFLHSQRGSPSFPGSFRWRGRSLSDLKVLPNTLSSGLDDYPRSPLPSADEHHVDLHCWMITAVGVMAKLGDVLLRRGKAGADSLLIQHQTEAYREQHSYLLDKLNILHWSEEHHGFFDVGLNSENATFSVEIFFKCVAPADHSKSVEVAVPLDVARSGATDFCPTSHSQALYPLGDGNGGYKHKEVYSMDQASVRLQHIPRVGYVSIFPLLLKHIAADDSKRLSAVLDMVESPDLLWTEHGLRSMAKTDRFYNKRNSPGDAPYWRGPIWININYLAISALHHYAHAEGCTPEIRTRVGTLYARLRDNVQRTVLGQYAQTGHFWEHYEDVEGRGTRGHPFSGWTALVLNIMAEKY